ncbi:LacI family DNA-binding transcriptional regulator [Peterkaempfera sp. SMS 1(5)a]|uniref:LacI family DNA-binding transcriptional regulator n=1 Tax=Peterkaempfera podocarpi TaxID=3232308 RepID=UPI00366C929A
MVTAPRDPFDRRVTVRDVAAHAGVSQATVSQVLNSSRPVSEATRARVTASIEELGFRPNHLARALRQQKSHTVAIVVPNITHVTYPMVARGAGEILGPLGYQVALYDTNGLRATEKQIVRTLTDRMVDGAIVFGYPLAPGDARALQESGVAIVNGNPGTEALLRWDTVEVDEMSAMRDLTRTVTARYAGQIAYIGGPVDHNTAPRREAGFRAGMQDLGRACDAGLMASAPYTWAGGRNALAAILENGMRPRLVVCANDMIAIGAMAAAREHGLDVPGDVAVTGYDNIDAAEMAVPPLTTIEPFPFEQGRAAARLLLERMTDSYAGTARHLTLAAEPVDRASA